MGYMDKQPSRMQGSGQGRGLGSGFFGVAPTRCLDECNACRGYLERPPREMNLPQAYRR